MYVHIPLVMSQLATRLIENEARITLGPARCDRFKYRASLTRKSSTPRMLCASRCQLGLLGSRD
jgi:hypothetical protein